jgi:elongation factor Ts
MYMVEQIKKLRELTSAPLKDCKEALEKTGGDLDQAQQYLKEQGILKAAKKADRETNEGTVVVKMFGNKTV